VRWWKLWAGFLEVAVLAVLLAKPSIIRLLGLVGEVIIFSLVSTLFSWCFIFQGSQTRARLPLTADEFILHQPEYAYQQENNNLPLPVDMPKW
jgi:hypothetical protein